MDNTKKTTLHPSFFINCACGFLDERSIDETLVFMGPWQDGKAAKAEGKENRSDAVKEAKEANPSEILRMQDADLGDGIFIFFCMF